jgi:hypothetical protein
MPRRVLALVPALLVAALLAAPGALAAQTSTLTAGATLLDQPLGRPWAIGLDVNATIATADGLQPSQLQRLQVKFPHATVNWGDFATCQLKRLEGRKGPDGCPAGALIGGGEALVQADKLFPEPVHASLDVFNGQAKGGGRQLLFLARTSGGLSVQLVFAGLLKRVSGGPYGYTLDVAIPRIPTIPGFADASVVGFNVHVEARRRSHGKRVSFLEAPTTCPKGGLPFLGTFSFADGSTGTSAAKIPCTLTSRPS